MTDSFKALLVNKTEDGQSAGYVQLNDADLMEGDVTVRVTHSSVNYKDGLAITGLAPILRRFPLIPGIDFAGIVISTADERYKPGDKVICTGRGIGEEHHGGYSERARVPGDWLVPLPDGMSLSEAMSIGTAGFTAMLCVMRLEELGLKKDTGDVIVTGAAGGVGSVAVMLLARLGFRVIASTGRVEEADYLKSLGAAEIISRDELSGKPRPLAKARFAGAVDVAGGPTLANLISQMNPDGIVTACGLADSADLPVSVMPFILRSVTLAGISSVTQPREVRMKAWPRLACELDHALLESMTTHVQFEEIPETAKAIIKGKIRGRVVVDITA